MIRSPFDIVGATDNPDQNTEDYLFQVGKYFYVIYLQRTTDRESIQICLTTLYVLFQLTSKVIDPVFHYFVSIKRFTTH